MKEKKTEEIKKEGEPLDAEKWENSRLDWKHLENTQLEIIVYFWFFFFFICTNIVHFKGLTDEHKMVYVHCMLEVSTSHLCWLVSKSVHQVNLTG